MKKLNYSDPSKLFDAITIFALRFDGYKYREENKVKIRAHLAGI